MIPMLHPIHKNCILLALETIAMMNVASVSVRRAGKSDIYARQEKTVDHIQVCHPKV